MLCTANGIPDDHSSHPVTLGGLSNTTACTRTHNIEGLTMKKFIIGVAGFGVLACTAIGLAGTAAASTADAIVNNLQAEGYTVQINQTPTAPLTACTVTSISKLASGAPSASIDIACPQGC
jgi:hypothetical protein